MPALMRSQSINFKKERKMNATKKAAEIIHEWDNVNWDYPNCGGTIGKIYSNGRVEIEHLSNVSGQASGDKSVWQLHTDALTGLINDLDYNDNYSYEDMCSSLETVAYVADMVSSTRGHIIR
jgi:hypothetical protein